MITSRSRVLTVVFAVIALLFAVPMAAHPQPPAPSLTDAPKKIHTDAHGSVRQVQPDSPVPPSADPGDPGAVAGAQAADVARLFGADAGSRLTTTTVSRRGSATTVRLMQWIGATPVYGGNVALALRADGALLSATGALAEHSLGGYPAGGGAPTVPARAAALTAVAGRSRSAAPPVVRSESAAWYDPLLSGADETAGPDAAVPAYRFDIASDTAMWRVFISAATDLAVLDTWPIERDLTRVVCDADHHGAPDRLATPCGARGSYPVVRTEGGPSVAGNDDANRVYDWIGDTEAFFARYTGLSSLTDLIGIDAHDGRGAALRGDVRVCIAECPYANAYWSGGQGIVMGGAVLGVDVVAHELAHGVTEHTSALEYRNESGAINESMSDVFGELTELATASVPHVAADRWKIGNGTLVGVVRDMRSPGVSATPQPAIYRGPNWLPATHSDRHPAVDLGGVHTNSGVGNRLAVLITDGEADSTRPFPGLGIAKTAALYWTVETLLYPGADYPALASTLLTACRSDATDGVAGLTENDCGRVRSAIDIVRIPLLAERV